MPKENLDQLPTDTVADLSATVDRGRRPFTLPKLTFVPPKLVKQGSIQHLTAGTEQCDSCPPP